MLSVLPVTTTGGFGVTGTEGQPSAVQTMATFLDPQGAQAASAYTANIDWGDGTTSPGTVVPGATSGGQADILFLTDTTGSMGGVIANLETAFNDIASAIASAYGPGSATPMDIHYGVADYKDYLDGSPYNTAGINLDQPFTSNVTAVQTAISSLTADGGEDWPEENLKALDSAANNWTLNDGSALAIGGRATAQKIIVWAGDAPGWYQGSTPDDGAPGSFYPSLDGTIADLKTAGVNVIGMDILPQNQGIDQSVPDGGNWDNPASPSGPNQEEAICTATGGLADYNIGYSTDLTTFENDVVGAITNHVNTTFSVQASHTYSEEGNYVVTTTVTDTAGTSAPAISSATVADAPLTGSSSATAGGAAGLLNSSVLSDATFTDANPGDHTADMTAVIDWGDGGATSPGTVSYSGGTYTVSGAHTYAATGAYPLSIAVSDDGGSTTTISGTATVVNATATVSVTDTGGPYTGSPYPATATVNGASSLEGVAPTLTYYVGSTASGTGSTAAPSAVGTYTVVASFAGSTDYKAATAQTTFTISQATPTIILTDTGGPYTGSPYPATATVNGASSLEGVPLILTYYVGSTVSCKGSTAAPSALGTYTVVASFAGSTDYTAATAQATFTISRATPTIIVTDAGGPYTGCAFPATATVNGRGCLECVPLTLTYYVGSTVSGKGSTAAPSKIGTYTAVASFAGSKDYTAATAQTTFTITQATPTIRVTDAGGKYTGCAFPAKATVNGQSCLEGVPLTLTYYVGSTVSGSGSTAAPSKVGTYTVVASFAGSTDYSAATAQTTFTITQATPKVCVTAKGGTYNGSPHPATATVNGQASLEGVTPTLTYYLGSTISGSGSTTAPITAGTYTVVASFAGSTDYAAATAQTTFTITRATPTVRVTDKGGPHNGSPYPATVTVNGATSLEGVTPTLTYYVGSTTSGSSSTTAPSKPGKYTVKASFAGSTDYASASVSVTFVIT